MTIFKNSKFWVQMYVIEYNLVGILLEQPASNSGDETVTSYSFNSKNTWKQKGVLYETTCNL